MLLKLALPSYFDAKPYKNDHDLQETLILLMLQ